MVVILFISVNIKKLMANYLLVIFIVVSAIVIYHLFSKKFAIFYKDSQMFEPTSTTSSKELCPLCTQDVSAPINDETAPAEEVDYL